MLACLASKPQKYPVTQTCKPKKIYNCATIPLQICNNTIAQLQTNIIYFIPSLSSSIFVSLLSLNIPSLSLTYPSHGGGIFWRGSWVRHGSSGNMEVFLDWQLSWLMGFSLTAVDGFVDGSLTTISVAWGIVTDG